MSPKALDLCSGNLLPIYRDFMNQKELEGHAVLLDHEPSVWRKETPYIRAELGSGVVRDFMTINWCFARWKVKFIDGPLKGFTTHRNIAYFLSIDNDLRSGYKMNRDEEEE